MSLDPRPFDEVGDVARDEPLSRRLAEGSMQNGVDVLGGPLTSPGVDDVGVEPFEVTRLQANETVAPDRWLNVDPNQALVGRQSAWPDVDAAKPVVEVGADSESLTRDRGTPGNGCLQLTQLPQCALTSPPVYEPTLPGDGGDSTPPAVSALLDAALAVTSPGQRGDPVAPSGILLGLCWNWSLLVVPAPCH